MRVVCEGNGVMVVQGNGHALQIMACLQQTLRTQGNRWI